MPQSATVARALRLITESTGVVPFCMCLTLPTFTGRREGGARRHWAAAEDGEGTAGSEASDEHAAARLAGVEGGGIARATPKGIVPVPPAGHSEVFPVPIPCGSRRELDSAVEKEFEKETLRILRNKRKNEKKVFAKPCETCIC